jgi:RNA-directed DNA polymerase
MMHGRGKSSPVIVARKPANKAQPKSVTAAESVERRAGAKGHARQQSTRRTQRRVSVSQALASIRQAAKLDCQYPRWEPYAGKPHVRVCAGGGAR